MVFPSHQEESLRPDFIVLRSQSYTLFLAYTHSLKGVKMPVRRIYFGVICCKTGFDLQDIEFLESIASSRFWAKNYGLN